MGARFSIQLLIFFKKLLSTEILDQDEILESCFWLAGWLAGGAGWLAGGVSFQDSKIQDEKQDLAHSSNLDLINSFGQKRAPTAV